MKLFCYGDIGQERLGLVAPDGTQRDLSRIAHARDPWWLTPEGLAAIAKANVDELPEVEPRQRVAPCVPAPSKIVGVGMNYADHAREAGVEPPKQPTLFMKPPSSLAGPFDDLILPDDVREADWEVELAVVIGRAAHRVAAADALAHVAGYAVANDLTERGMIRSSGQLLDGKGLDGFTPLGPWLVTADEVPDPQDLALSLTLNGEVQQDGTTATMIFSVASVIAHVSHRMTLLPGDVILTGTPPGIGLRKSPPRFLRDGDAMTLSVAGLGEQRQRVRQA